MSANAPIWDDGDWRALPPLTADTDADVCVVGLGGAGIAALHAARESGLSAVGIDARAVGGGAAGRNGGFLLAGLAAFHHEVVASLGRERAARCYRATLTEIDRLAATHGDLVRSSGSLRLADDAREVDDCAAQLDAMRSDALPVEPYRDGSRRGLLFPADAAYAPLALARREATLAIAHGARLHEATPALQIDGDRVVTPRGVVRARHVLVCVDGGLEALLPRLCSTVRSARLQMLASAPVAPLLVPRPVYARWGWDYWQQTSSGAVVVGGARDIGGDDEWTSRDGTSVIVQTALERILRERLGVSARITHRWAAHCAFHDGVLPIVARQPDGVIACGAYNGTGNVWSRISGRAALALALDRRSDERVLLGV